jgi:outer membrane assembly lipoprotein YfiO
MTATPLRPAALLALAAALLAIACAGDRSRIPPGTLEPDKLLYERGTAALNDRKWLTAREYFRQIVEGYPQSPYRADAKLGLGDTYLGEGGAAASVLAINEFREFLAFFPTHARADYAQFKLAMAHYYQMAKPERDQTETREAIKEFEVFFERFPNSSLMPEVRQRYREARDRLSESEYRVGLFYFRAKWYPGAIDRFKSVLQNDPEYTGRDAVYYYLAETLTRTDKPAEALVYYERLASEFVQSEYLAEAQKRIAELKAANAKGSS